VRFHLQIIARYNFFSDTQFFINRLPFVSSSLLLGIS